MSVVGPRVTGGQSLWEGLGQKLSSCMACLRAAGTRGRASLGVRTGVSLSFYSLPCGCLRFEGKQGANAVLEVSGLSHIAQSMDESKQGLSPQPSTFP